MKSVKRYSTIGKRSKLKDIKKIKIYTIRIPFEVKLLSGNKKFGLLMSNNSLKRFLSTTLCLATKKTSLEIFKPRGVCLRSQTSNQG